MRIGKEVYPLEIDYSQTFDQMLEAAAFDYINSGITAEHFPFSGSGLQKVELVLFHYPTFMNTDDILRDIESAGYHPARIEDLLSFAIKYPDEQRHGNPIIGLGSIWRRAELEQVVPILRGGDKDRNMHLLRINNKWNPCEFFAATRIVQ